MATHPKKAQPKPTPPASDNVAAGVPPALPPAPSAPGAIEELPPNTQITPLYHQVALIFDRRAPVPPLPPLVDREIPVSPERLPDVRLDAHRRRKLHLLLHQLQAAGLTIRYHRGTSKVMQPVQVPADALLWVLDNWPEPAPQ